MSQDSPSPPESDVPMAVRRAAETWEGEEPVMDGPSAPFLPSVVRRAWDAMLHRSAVWGMAIVINLAGAVVQRHLGALGAAGVMLLIGAGAAPALAFTGPGRRRGHRLTPRRLAAAVVATAMASLILVACFRAVEAVMGGIEAPPAG